MECIFFFLYLWFYNAIQIYVIIKLGQNILKVIKN